MSPDERRAVDNAIEAVLNRFRNTPNVFLTEDDLRMHLCNELMQDYGQEEATNDGDVSIALHSEVRWYGDTGRLKCRSDIVLVDTRSLDVLKYNRMPSKGYRFNVPKGIIELKLRRPNGPSDRAFSALIDQDIRKLKELRSIFHEAEDGNETGFWLVVLDKKCRLDPLPVGSDRIRVAYRFGTTRHHV